MTAIRLVVDVFRDLVKHRALTWYLILSELKTQNINTFLGYLWWLLDPLAYMLTYVLLVVVIFERGGPAYPVFVFCALIPWKWTLSTMTDSVNAISGRSSLVQQVYIPKAIFPFVKVSTTTMKFFFGLVILLVFTFFFGISPSKQLMWLPFIVMNQLLFNVGLALVFADLGVFFRDIKNILQFVSRLWFYLSPGLYAMDRIPSRFQVYAQLNPLVWLFESYRNIFMNNTPPVWRFYGPFLLMTVILWVFGLYRVRKNEYRYVKVV